MTLREGSSDEERGSGREYGRDLGDAHDDALPEPATERPAGRGVERRAGLTEARATGREGAGVVADARPAAEPARPPAPAAPAAPAPGAPAPGAPAPVPPSAKRRRPLRRLVLLAILIAAAGFGALKGREWWTVGRFFVSTDDAYVQADITTIAAKVSGYLTAVEVANNQPVHRGDVIARVDDTDYRLAVQAAQDKLATQGSTIQRIARQGDAARAAVDQAAAGIDAAKADAVRTVADYARQLQLAQTDYASRARLEQSRADRDRAEAMVKNADATLLAAKANVAVLEAQRVEAERLAQELRTAVDRAQRDLDYTLVRAPLDGIVGNKAVETGAYVGAGSHIAALVPLATVRVEANFKETQLARMRVGQPVLVAVDAYPDHDIEGTVESFSPASGSVFSLLPPENATGNFTKIVQRLPVRVRVPREVAESGRLRPGLSVVARVDTREPAGNDAGPPRRAAER